MLALAASDVADWLALPIPVFELTVMIPANDCGLIVTEPVVTLIAGFEPPGDPLIEMPDTEADSVSSDTVALTLPTVMAWLSEVVTLWLLVSPVLVLVVVLLPLLLTEREVLVVLLWLSVVVVVLLLLSETVFVSVLLPELEIVVVSVVDLL